MELVDSIYRFISLDAKKLVQHKLVNCHTTFAYDNRYYLNFFENLGMYSFCILCTVKLISYALMPTNVKKIIGAHKWVIFFSCNMDSTIIFYATNVTSYQRLFCKWLVCHVILFICVVTFVILVIHIAQVMVMQLRSMIALSWSNTFMTQFMDLIAVLCVSNIYFCLI